MSSDDRLKGCRVLIVEDEYFLAYDLEQAFEAHGAIVVGPVAQFDEACDQVDRDDFDVAILDLNLHDEKTYPIADELMRQKIPLVFCTGYDAKAIPERFAHVRVWHKPFEPRGLIEHVAQLCQCGS